MRLLLITIVMTIGVVSVSVLADTPFSASRVDYPVGQGPRAICVADFNGDSEFDLAVANTNSNNVSVLLGVGDGTFLAAVSYDAGTEPSGICAANVDGDGDIDLAVTNFMSDDVTILKNDGLGVFAAPVSYAVGVDGIGPRAICAAELNGSGLIDLAVADEWGDSITVLINNDDGTFPSYVTYSTGLGSTPFAICAANFDGSGSVDLAVANSGFNSVSIFTNAGGGTFTGPVDYAVNGTPRAITTADVDGNGSYDIATANSATHDVSVLKNNGDGTFGTASNYLVAGAATRGICAVELNGDTDLDLAAVTNTSDEVALLMNLGSGNFDQPALDYPVGLGPTAVCGADFDGDMDNDLAITNFDDNTVTILLNGTDILVGIDDGIGYDALPASVALGQNYPNPFNLNTIIAFSLPNRSSVSVVIYNALGQKVRVLADRSFSAGDHALSWDGRNDVGDVVAGGLYLYRLVAGQYVENRKMLLIK
ncbi:MAG: VCBS repeat-containing protein [Candidatus Zixiibacteriota bacterium]|nr:MAG: VCBS repeat-containing protein [candidate division Zixibacteria bacterium]